MTRWEVYDEYQANRQRIQGAMLRTVFQRLASIDTSTSDDRRISVQMMKDVLEEIERHHYVLFPKGFFSLRGIMGLTHVEESKQDQMRSVLGNIGLPVSDGDMNFQDLTLLISNFRKDDVVEDIRRNSAQSTNQLQGYMDEEEFRITAVLHNLPFYHRDWSSLESRWIAEQLATAEQREALTMQHAVYLFLEQDTGREEAAEHTTRLSKAWMWAARFPALREHWLHSKWGWLSWTRVSHTVIVLSLCYAFVPSNETDVFLWPIFVFWFCVEVVVGFLVDATRFSWFEHFKYYAAWVDLAMAIVGIAICFDIRGSADLWATARLLRVFMVINHHEELRDAFYSVRLGPGP